MINLYLALALQPARMPIYTEGFMTTRNERILTAAFLCAVLVFCGCEEQKAWVAPTDISGTWHEVRREEGGFLTHYRFRQRGTDITASMWLVLSNGTITRSIGGLTGTYRGGLLALDLGVDPGQQDLLYFRFTSDTRMHGGGVLPDIEYSEDLRTWQKQ